MTAEFVPGLELSRRLYREAVEPLLRQHVPGLAHTAALIGAGSEVLGFDTERSTDHNWGPRLQLFLHPDDLRTHGEDVDDLIAERLPATLCGYPTNLAPVGDRGTRHMRSTDGRIQHGAHIADLGDWLTGQLGFDPLTGVTTLDWLATPTQALAEVTGGAVFHDGLDRLHRVRRVLAWYPDDLWRYLLACQWQRISEEEAFVGRAGEVGDELGSAVIATRLVRDLMRLCLLMARRYPPYSKWLGSAFAQLTDAQRLTPVLTAAMAATCWPDREGRLATAYEIVAARHNTLELTPPVDPRTRPYHDRPFRVLHAERLAEELLASVSDQRVRSLPRNGGIDQYVDRTDVLCRRTRSRALAAAVFPAGPHHAPAGTDLRPEIARSE